MEVGIPSTTLGTRERKSQESQALGNNGAAQGKKKGTKQKALFLMSATTAAAFVAEEDNITHALLAHEEATKASEALKSHNLDEARVAHLGAAQNFLEAAEACSDGTTKKGLLLLSRAHARAATQVAERLKRSAEGKTSQENPSFLGRAADRPVEPTQKSQPAPQTQLREATGTPETVHRLDAFKTRKRPVADSAESGPMKEFLALEKVLARLGERPLRRQTRAASSSMAEALSASISIMPPSSGVLDSNMSTAASPSSTSQRHVSRLPTSTSLREPLTLSAIEEAQEQRRDRLVRNQKSTEIRHRAANVDYPMTKPRSRRASEAAANLISSKEYASQHAELIRCLKATQLLHDENAKLLDDNHELREKAKLVQDMENFKLQYSHLFKKVKEELIKFREAYPHMKNPAASVPSTAEKQLRQLVAAYEKKSRKLAHSEARNVKLQQQIQQFEAKLKQYEAAFRKLSNRAHMKAQSRRSQAGAPASVPRGREIGQKGIDGTSH